MTTQTEIKLKWHKAKYGGEWEAEYPLPHTMATVTITREGIGSGDWGFFSSEDWEHYDTHGISGFKTLKQAKIAALEAVESDLYCECEALNLGDCQ